MNNQARKIKVTSRVCVSLLVMCLISIACEVDTSIKMDGKNPPSFSFSGSGNLISFMIMEVPPENQKQKVQRSSDANRLLWEIRPSSADNRIRNLPEITYGKIPTGFNQHLPNNGSAPEPLLEGKIYEASGTAYNANGGLIWFRVEGDKTVQITVPGTN